jgi:hypothetical protein
LTSLASIRAAMSLPIPTMLTSRRPLTVVRPLIVEADTQLSPFPVDNSVRNRFLVTETLPPFSELH